MTTFNLSVLCMYMPIQFALVNVTQCEFWKEMIISGRPGCRQAGCCYVQLLLGKWSGLPTDTGNNERSSKAAESKNFLCEIYSAGGFLSQHGREYRIPCERNLCAWKERSSRVIGIVVWSDSSNRGLPCVLQLCGFLPS